MFIITCCATLEKGMKIQAEKKKQLEKINKYTCLKQDITAAMNSWV